MPANSHFRTAQGQVYPWQARFVYTTENLRGLAVLRRSF